MLLFFNPGIDSQSIKTSAQNKGLSHFSCLLGCKGSPVPGDSKELDCTHRLAPRNYISDYAFLRGQGMKREKAVSPPKRPQQKHVRMNSLTLLYQGLMVVNVRRAQCTYM